MDRHSSISIYLSSIVTNEDKTWYVSFYLLLANSMTSFNNQQYRRFPSIFGIEYGVGNRPLTGSMSVYSRNSESGSYCRIRPSTRLTPASPKPDSFRNHRRPDPPHRQSQTGALHYWKPVHVRRPDPLPPVHSRTIPETTTSQPETTADQTHYTASPNSGPHTTEN